MGFAEELIDERVESERKRVERWAKSISVVFKDRFLWGEETVYIYIVCGVLKSTQPKRMVGRTVEISSLSESPDFLINSHLFHMLRYELAKKYSLVMVGKPKKDTVRAYYDVNCSLKHEVIKIALKLHNFK